METKWTTEDKTRRWEYHRELKNLMGKYMFSLLLNRENTIWDKFWSQCQEDVCLGFNNGWYSGREAVAEYYAGRHEAVVRTSALMREIFPDKLGDKTDEEIFGAGPYNSKPVSNAVIEIAGDEKTARGMWYSRGSQVKIGVSGSVSYWTWGVYAVDFIRESDEWRIWHMQYLEDINSPCGQSWGAPVSEYPAAPGFEKAAGLEDCVPEPNVPCLLRALYTPDRPFTRLPDYPTPYQTYSDTTGYGMKEEGTL